MTGTTRRNSFLLKTQEATAWVEEKTISLSKANSLEVVPLEKETLSAHCHCSKLLNNSIIVCSTFLKSAEGRKKVWLETIGSHKFLGLQAILSDILKQTSNTER